MSLTRVFIFLLLLISFVNETAFGESINSIHNKWIFTHILYRGQLMPAPNPDLVMTFNFQDLDVNELMYFRKNEPGFCRRLAQYQIFNSNTLFQKVIYTDPLNSSNCSTDVDMLFGYESYSSINFINNQLYIEFPLGDEFIYFIWSILK